jgi:5-methylcytosine-specific restriction endonuclease McrA
MASRAHRFPGDNTPLTAFHGGSFNAARRAVQRAKALRSQVFTVMARLDAEAPPRRDRLRPKAKSARECLVERIAEIQGHRCSLCGRSFGNGPDAPTVEHVVPRARGGRNARNRLVAHSACNNAKGDRMPSQRELVLLANVNAALEAG